MRHLLASLVLTFTAPASAEQTVVESNTPAASKSGYLVEHIGIETLGGVFTPLLERGCKIPCEITQVFSTAEDNQSEILLSLLRGNTARASQAKSLGKFVVVGVDAQPRGAPQIAIRFSVQGASVAVEAFDKQSKKPLAIVRREP